MSCTLRHEKARARYGAGIMHVIVKSRGTGQAENAADGGARPCLFLQILDRNRCPIWWVSPLCAFVPWPAV
jgi:hypothetical protein